MATGRRGDRAAEVLDGLAGGEPVILCPGDTITDAALVRPADG